MTSCCRSQRFASGKSWLWHYYSSHRPLALRWDVSLPARSGCSADVSVLLALHAGSRYLHLDSQSDSAYVLVWSLHPVTPPSRPPFMALPVTAWSVYLYLGRGVQKTWAFLIKSHFLPTSHHLCSNFVTSRTSEPWPRCKRASRKQTRNCVWHHFFHSEKIQQTEQ